MKAHDFGKVTELMKKLEQLNGAIVILGRRMRSEETPIRVHNSEAAGDLMKWHECSVANGAFYEFMQEQAEVLRDQLENLGVDFSTSEPDEEDEEFTPE